MSKLIRHCSHCNNTAPFEIVYQESTSKLWDQAKIWHQDDQRKSNDAEEIDIIESYVYCVVRCDTCEHISLLGGFKIENRGEAHRYPQLYPSSPELPDSVPKPIWQTYLEAARIRVRAPNAYAGQIRKALEFLCNDKGATGKDLFRKLQSLASKGVLPSTLAEMTDLIREIGNAGVHAGGDAVSVFDTELIDEFFKSVVDYVYIAPAKIARLKGMLAAKKEKPEDIPF